MNWIWILLSYASLISFGLIDNARGPLYPEILSFFSLTTTVGSLTFTLASLSGVLTCLTNHYWLSRFGALKSLKFFLLLQGLSTFGLGGSGYLPHGFLFHLLFSFLFGISTGGSGLCMNILVAHGSSEKWRRQALSGLHSMYGISSLIAPSLIGLWIQKNISWQNSFIFLAFCPLLIFIGSLFLKSGEDKAKEEKTPRTLFPVSYYFIFGGLLALCVCAELSLSTQIPLFCHRVLGWELDKSSFQLSLFFFFLLLGRLTFSLFPFPGKSHTWLILSTVFAGISYLLGLVFHPFFLSFAGFFISIFFPCMMDWVTTLFSKKSENLIGHMMTIEGFFIVVMHLSLGVFTEIVGLRNALFLGPVFLFLCAFLLFFFRKKVFKAP